MGRTPAPDTLRSADDVLDAMLRALPAEWLARVDRAS
jgi:hypothetical protein